MKKVLVLFIALLVFPVIVQANDASMGRRGETVYPLEETDVRMVSEDIYIKFHLREASHTTCEFVFENSGEAKTVLMGFPAEEKIDIESMTSVENVRLNNFTANINGIPIEVNEISGSDMEGEFSEYTSWYVFEVPFKEGETLVMTHDYDINFTVYSTGHYTVGYILETGSTWGGNIGHTKVTFDLTEMNHWAANTYHYSYLNAFRYEDGMLIFEKSNYTPDFNLEIQVFGPAAKNYPGTVWPEIQKEFNIFKEFFENSIDLPAEELVNSYNGLGRIEKFIETVYLNTILGISDQPYAPIATKMEAKDSKRFWIYVNDRNFDIEDNATITLMGNSNNVIFSGFLYKTNRFTEYGTIVYSFSASEERVKEAIVNKLVSSYVITVVDEMGNESNTVFAGDDLNNKRTTIVAGIVDDGSEEYVIENPPTSASVDYLSLAILFLLSGIGIVCKKMQIEENS